MRCAGGASGAAARGWGVVLHAKAAGEPQQSFQGTQERDVGTGALDRSSATGCMFLQPAAVVWGKWNYVTGWD